MNYLSHFVSALCSLALSIIDIWQYLLAIKMGRNLHRSDLIELCLRVQNDGIVKCLWQEFLIRYGTHFR